MKKKISVLIVAVLTLIVGGLHALESLGDFPLETVILSLFDHSESNWKEISRHVEKKYGIIETIPVSQTVENWSDLICIQYFDSSEWDKKAKNSISYILDKLRKETFRSYPENTVTWKIIEKDKRSAIFEWILLKPYHNIPVQHEIARGFLTKTGFHRLGYTKKNKQMNSEEREKWIKLLKNNSSVVSFREAAYNEGLSMVDKLKDLVALGPNFQNWKIVDSFAYANGCALTTYIPPMEDCICVTEGLETFTMPTSVISSVTKFFEVEKKGLKSKVGVDVECHIIEQSPSEIIYSYCHPKDHLHCNAVVRTFLTDRGYYSISYKHGLMGKMSMEEISDWKEKLKTILVEVPEEAGLFKDRG